MFAERKRGSLMASKFKLSFFFYDVLIPFFFSRCVSHISSWYHSKDFFCLYMMVEATIEWKVRSDIM